MLDKHLPSDSAPRATPRSQPPARESWGGCIAIVLSVMGMIGCVALALGMIFIADLLGNWIRISR